MNWQRLQKWPFARKWLPLSKTDKPTKRDAFSATAPESDTTLHDSVTQKHSDIFERDKGLPTRASNSSDPTSSTAMDKNSVNDQPPKYQQESLDQKKCLNDLDNNTGMSIARHQTNPQTTPPLDVTEQSSDAHTPGYQATKYNKKEHNSTYETPHSTESALTICLYNLQDTTLHSIAEPTAKQHALKNIKVPVVVTRPEPLPFTIFAIHLR